MTNPASGINSPITNAATNGEHLSYTTTRASIQTTITWDATVHADRISGQATVSGAATFPFDGTRT